MRHGGRAVQKSRRHQGPRTLVCAPVVSDMAARNTDQTSRRASSPIGRRHRRSYTISAPLGVRADPFPNPAPAPRSQTPSRKTPEARGKENRSPALLQPTVQQDEPKPLNKARFSASDSALVKPPPIPEQPPAELPAPLRRPRIFHTTSIFNDRFLDLPPLPDAWTQRHDRAICVLDSRNYSHNAIVAKLRRVFPELRGTLTPLMVDKRLRILDPVSYTHLTLPTKRIV